MTRDALRLASKGATYSANAKLIEVLELTADQLDTNEGTTAHREALSAGLLAFREAEDLTKSATSSPSSNSLSLKDFGHNTPLPGLRGTERLTRTEALELYYSYANQQLALAVSGAPQGSAALCHLGRLQPFLSEESDRHNPVVATKMITWHQAALEADAQNYRAANELGVVLASSGQWEAAKEALITSAELGERPETIANLGVVLHRLGDASGGQSMLDLAQRRRQQRLAGKSNDDDDPPGFVRWVDHHQFSVQAAVEDIPSVAKEIPTHNSSTTKLMTRSNITRAKFGWPRLPWTQKSSVQRDSVDQPRPLKSAVRTLSGTQTAHTETVPRIDPKVAGGMLQRDATIDHVGYEAERDEPIIYDELQEMPAMPVPDDAGCIHSIPELGQSHHGVPFDTGDYGHGDYVGSPRMPHVPEYYLRVDDVLGFVFRLNGKPSSTPYRLNVGDVVRVTSMTADNFTIETLVQPDGTIVLPQIGSVTAAGKTIDVLRQEIDDRMREFIREPSIAVTPVTINKTLEELRNAIITRTGLFNGQLFSGRVAPDGMIQLPAIGSVPAQGLTLEELRVEVEHRYAEVSSGVEITPILQQRAPRFIYVVGEVQRPGRFELTGPTTAIQSISLAGGWNRGGNVREVIVFRRDEGWRLMALKLNVRPALYNKPNLAADDIWLRDSDIVIVPKLPIQVADDWIEMTFTRGIYGIVPFSGISLSFFKDLSTLGLAN